MIYSIVICTAVLAIISYLCGSVNFAIIFTRHYANTDVREHGSGNAGMTNVLRTAGKKPAILTFVCDFLKGAVTAAIGKYLLLIVVKNVFGQNLDGIIDPLYFAYLAGLFCIVGHIFPLYFSFKGGKGVATLAGIFLIVDWRVLIIALSTFGILLAITKIVSISSIIAAISLPISTFFLYNSNTAYTFRLFGLSQKSAIVVWAALFSLIVVISHRANIGRLIRGEEKRISSKKEK